MVFGVAALAVTAIWIVAVTTGGSSGARPTGGSASVYPAASIPAPRVRSLGSAAAKARCTLRSFPSYGSEQTSARIQYRTNPPTSGPSDPAPAADGIYDEPAGTSKLVRALARGRVIYQFAPGAPPKLRGQLKTLVNEDPRHVILTVNQTGMPYAVAVTAWRHYLGCSSLNGFTFDALRDFRSAYRDRAG